MEVRKDERRGRRKFLYGDTVGLSYGAAVRWEMERGARAFADLRNVGKQDMASSETIRRMTHLSNLLNTEDMGSIDQDDWRNLHLSTPWGRSSLAGNRHRVAAGHTRGGC